MKYNKIVEFFFIKNRFINIVSKNNPQQINNTIQKKDSETEYLLMSDNFILMLELLFPTALYVVNNINTSLSQIISLEKQNVTDFLSFKGTNISWFPVLPKKYDKKFSYLKINNKIYTIAKTVWINDVMNHPIYSKILNSYFEFKKWKSNNDFKQSIKTEKKSIIKLFMSIIQIIQI
jgi:hypothetical protein